MKKIHIDIACVLMSAAILLCTLDPPTQNPLDRPPLVTAMEDTTVKINDNVCLHVSASDPNGTVDSVQWSIDTRDNWRKRGIHLTHHCTMDCIWEHG